MTETFVEPHPSQSVKNLIVLPTFNERSTLRDTVARLQELPASFELLIVDDGSTDGTAEIADELAGESRLPLRVVHLRENCGIGVAVQTGYLFATQNPGYRYVIQFDADGQHDARSVLDLVRVSDQRELDLCIGPASSRTIHGGSDPRACGVSASGSSVVSSSFSPACA